MVDGLDLGITGQPQRLLGVLIAERDRVVSTDLLVERLWPDRAPATAAKVVHVLIGRLRRALEPELVRAAESQVIRKAGGGYALSTGPTDLDRYLDLAEAATGQAGESPRRGPRPHGAAWSSRGAAVGPTRPTRRALVIGRSHGAGHRGRGLGPTSVVVSPIARFDRSLPRSRRGLAVGGGAGQLAIASYRADREAEAWRGLVTAAARSATSWGWP